MRQQPGWGTRGLASLRGAGAAFWRTPVRVRVYLVLVGVAALVLPLVVGAPLRSPLPQGLTALMLVAASVINVELARVLSGGLARSQQPHKALSSWAVACALMLPPEWLLVIVPVTYVHARWRGIRVVLWKWVGSAAFLVVAGVAAAAVRHLLSGSQSDWMIGNGGRGLVTVVVSCVVFLLVETALFAGIAWLNDRDDEVWLRRTLASASYYRTELAVLLMGALLAAVWTGGAWFTLLFVPIYALAQRAALHEPLREQADLAAELAARNADLERAHQFKVDLLGMLGHEIGNPLTSVQGFAELGAEALALGDLPTARHALGVIERSGGQVRDVVHDILAMVSAEGAVLVATPEPCPLAPRLQAAVTALPGGQVPSVRCAEGLSARVQPGHLDQVLANLLGNAAKYAGGATFLEAVPLEDGRVQISVEDAGPGVPDRFRTRLFDRFSRDDASASRIEGTGLGLFITRELARANGGDVTHRDREPSGSVFAVTLPGV
ncbi:MAG: sensor histidine kinase [Marmoricola sp.]